MMDNKNTQDVLNVLLSDISYKIDVLYKITYRIKEALYVIVSAITVFFMLYLIAFIYIIIQNSI